MKIIHHLKPLGLLLFSTLSTVFMIEAGLFSPWLAGLCGAVAAFGLHATIQCVSEKPDAKAMTE